MENKVKLCEFCGENPGHKTRFGFYCESCERWCNEQASKEEEAEQAALAAQARAEYLRDVARTFCRRCKAAEYETSGLSEAVYITVHGLKVRLADHTARPTYEQLNGAADIELGRHDFAAPLPDTIKAAVKEIRRRIATVIWQRRRGS